MTPATQTTPRTILAPAFRAGVALAASHLEGPANDAPEMVRASDPHRADVRDVYVCTTRALTRPTIVDALDGACRVRGTSGGVLLCAWEALAGAYAATGTSETSRAARVAVAVIAATLTAHGIDAV